MPKQLQFRISSDLKTLIGKELITNDNVAIFELVKNSYDANAKNVTIIFQNIESSKNAKIFVKDDGDGMSFDDLEKKWLFVGFSEKRKMNESLEKSDFRDKIAKRRILAGAKGIGRFSCDKLGRKLKLYTKKMNESSFHVLDVDWIKFEEKPQTEFQTITVDYDEEKCLNDGMVDKDFSHGTIIEISSLRSLWDRTKLLDLKRHLQRLINPIQIENQKFTINLEADDYREIDKEHSNDGDFAIINGPINNFVLEKLDLKTTNIICSIDSTGQQIHSELWDKGTFIFAMDEKNEFPLKNILIKIFYLNRAAKNTFTRTMGIESVNFGSIFFYKNGIKINPYGDVGDDWLKLDSRKTQGMQRYFGTREVLGRVEVNGYQPGFTEVSSRIGGVIKTPEFDALVELCKKKALRKLERYVVEALGWDSEEFPKDEAAINADSLEVISKILGRKPDESMNIKFNPSILKIYEEKQIEKTPEIIKSIKSLKKHVKSKQDRDSLDNKVKSISSAFNRLQSKKKELERDLELTESQNSFLRRLKDEDKEDMIGLQHHIVHATRIINGYLRELKNDISRSSGRISKEDLIETIDEILVQTSLIRSMVEYVNKASFDVKTSKIKKDIVQFVKQYVENVYTLRYRRAIKKAGFSINVSPENGLIFIHDFNPLDLVTVIYNLIDNSEKAGAKKVTIFINKLKESEGIEIRIRDDGKGINQRDFEKIFELGFSTTGGTGIGLYAIKKIVVENNWKIKINQTINTGAEFILEVQK